MSSFLIERMDQINEKYFNFDSLPLIKWSRGRIKKKYRKLTFGTYDIKKMQIRIHPILKNNIIPGFVLDFVIYHELLHYEQMISSRVEPSLVKPVQIKPVFHKINTRKKLKVKIHSIEFHKREREFPQKKEASRIMKDIVIGSFTFASDTELQSKL